MTLGKYLVISGLALDIGGVIFLYRYGLPSRYPERPSLALHEEPDEDRRTQFRRLSRTGFSLLVTGFALQLLGTVWSP